MLGEQGQELVLPVTGHDDRGPFLGTQLFQKEHDSVAVDVIQALGGFIQQQ